MALNKSLRWLGVFAATLLICMVSSFPVYATSIFVYEGVSYPLTLIVMGLLAALTSSWSSNLWAGDSAHSRVLRIIGTTEVAAMLLYLFGGGLIASANIVLLSIWGILISGAAYLSARRFRSPEYNKRRDVILSLVLLALAPALVATTMAFASRLGLTGA